MVGDFADLGKTEEMQWFADDMKECIQDGTKLVVTMANHELHYMPDYNVALNDFKNIFKMDYDRHEIMGGYHFISLSSIRDKGPWDDSFNDEKKAFLKEKLEIARKDTGNKPIFVFQHAGIPETIAGGVGGHTELYSILSNYPQVIDFSGHSHNPVNDPREINQKNFTCVGTGSMSYLSTSAAWHDFHIEGNSGLGKEQAHMLIVEADANGRIRILGLDAVEKKFISESFIADCHDKSKHIYTMQRATNAPKPYFETGAKPVVNKVNGKTVVTFPAAKCEGERVKEYCVRLTDEKGVVLSQKNVFSDYMHYTQQSVVNVEFDENFGNVSGATVYAVGFWDNVSQPIE